MKKKGFTLIELLAVIAVLGVLVTFISIQVMNSIADANEKSYKIMVKSIENSAQVYMADHASEYNTLNTPGSIIYVPLQKLIDNGYLDAPIKNPKSNTDIPATANVKVTVIAEGNIETAFLMDINGPVVSFGTNGNTCAKTASTTVDVSDSDGLDVDSLFYQWTTTTIQPPATSFTKNFSNGDTITSSTNLNDTYYLWVKVADVYGNISFVRSNAFHIDNVPPVIALTPPNPFNMDVGSSYVDPGATATDNTGGNITSSIVPTSNLNPNFPGTYTLTYTVSYCGSTTTATRTINVVDNAPPVIACNPNGNSAYAKSYSPTVTVSDVGGVDSNSLKYQWTTSTTAPTEESFSTSFTSGSSINTPAGVSGGYYLWGLAKDMAGNTAISSCNVFNLDNTPPVITMAGSSPVTISTGATYTDAGATASDNINGNITSSIQTTSTVNVNVPGSYTVTYRVSDTAGNAATQVVRTVTVVDTVPPVVAFGQNGNGAYVKSTSTTVTVTDNVAVNTGTLKYLWSTSTAIPGEASFSTGFTNGTAIGTPGGVTGGYYLWILAKDTSGNTTITRTNVFYLDNTPPSVPAISRSPGAWTTGNVTLTPSGSSDGHSGIHHYALSSNPSASVPYVSTQATGTYYFVAVDGAGNVSGAAGATISARTEYQYADHYVNIAGGCYYKSTTAGIYGIALASGTTPFVFEARVLFTDVSSNFYIFDSSTSDGSPRFALWYRATSGHMALYSKYSTTVYIDYEFNFSPSPWVIYDLRLSGGTDASRGYNLTVNGGSVGTAGSSYRFADTGQNTFIGSRYTAADKMNGRIYYFNFQARKANTADVYYHYSATSGYLPHPWYADEGTSTNYSFNNNGCSTGADYSDWSTSYPDMSGRIPQFRTVGSRTTFY